MKEIGILIGTRPEAIKLVPVIRELELVGAKPKVFVTGQHDELLNPILSELEIPQTENLKLMEADQALEDLSARVLTGMCALLSKHRPQLLLVQGDTTSVAMSALAGFYQGIKVAHIEAGLRTHSPRNPFPEEMNRRLVACLAEIHFAPTLTARDNLLSEGVPPEQIHLVGNTVIDTLFHARDHLLNALSPEPVLENLLGQERDIVLITGHRRESFGPDLASICEGIHKLAIAYKDRVDFFYPVHLNPNVQKPVRRILSAIPNIHLSEPLSYLRFVQLMLHAKLIITDSGGVQEEAAALGIPVLVTRRTCERLEAVEVGVSEVVGPDKDRIFDAADLLLSDQAEYSKRAVPTDVFGDGQAAKRIVEILLRDES